MIGAGASSSTSHSSSLQEVLDFCRQQLDPCSDSVQDKAEDDTFQASSPFPAERLTEETALALLKKGKYLPVLRGLQSQPLQERLSFLRREAAFHGPLLFERTVAEIESESASSSDQCQRAAINAAMKSLTEATCATQILEFFLENKTSPEAELENETSPEAELERQDQNGKQLIAEHLKEAAALRDVIPNIRQDQRIPIYLRMYLLYRVKIDNACAQQALIRRPQEQGYMIPYHTHFFLMAMQQQLKGAQPQLPYVLIETPGTREKAVVLVQAVHATYARELLRMVESLLQSKQWAEEKSRQVQNLIEGFLGSFKAGRIPFSGMAVQNLLRDLTQERTPATPLPQTSATEPSTCDPR